MILNKRCEITLEWAKCKNCGICCSGRHRRSAPRFI